MKKPELSLIVIAGPTASGKSAAAIELASKIDGEIISADSRTVYKDADIGTAKPSLKDQAKIKHYGLNLAELGKPFTAHDFKLMAQKAIKVIRSKKKIPIIVGGSGLYIDGLVYDFSFRQTPNPEERSKLNNLSISELQQMVSDKKLRMPENKLNKRHLIRVIETEGETYTKQQLSDDVIYTGLLPSDRELKSNINSRIEKMYQTGFLDEVTRLSEQHGSEQITSAGIGYKSALDYIQGRISADEARQIFKTGDWQLARRQKTWFKRNPDITWFDDKKALQTHILAKLSK